MSRDERTREMQKLEQCSATVGDMYPPLWRRIYVNLLSEGFNKQQAMSILKVYILAQNSTNGIIIRGTDTPEKQDD